MSDSDQTQGHLYSVPAPRNQHWKVIGVVLACLLAIGLRAYQLGSENYWMDEMHSLGNSAGLTAVWRHVPDDTVLQSIPNASHITPQCSTTQVWESMAYDSHPPMYFMFLLHWRNAWGDDEAWVRSGSVLFALLSFLPVAAMVYRLQGFSGMLWMLLLLSCASADLAMSQQARPYALALLWVNISYWLVTHLETQFNRSGHTTTWSIALIVAWLGSMLTHYFCVLALVGQVVYVWIRWPRVWRWKYMLWLAVAVVLFVVVWGAKLLEQVDYITSLHFGEIRPEHYLTDPIIRLANLPIRLLYSTTGPSVVLWSAAIGLLLYASMILFGRKLLKSSSLVFICWYGFGAIALVILDLSTQRDLLGHIRYPYILLPGLIGWLVLTTSLFSRFWRHVLPFMLVISMLVFLRYPTRINPQGQAAANWLEYHAGPEDLIIFEGREMPHVILENIYLCTTHYFTNRQRNVLRLAHPPSPELQKQMSGSKRCFVLLGRTTPLNPGEYPDYDLVGVSPGFRRLGQIFVIQPK